MNLTPTSGAQVVPASPEASISALPVEPSNPMVTSESLIEDQPNPVVTPTPVDTITAQPSALPIAETNTPAEAAHNHELFPITPPEIEEPQVAPAVEAPKSVEQPTVTMAESLPTGVAALSERVTLEAPPPGTLPSEAGAAQPIEPEIPQPAPIEAAQTYEPIIPPQPDSPEGHGKAPETTGGSMMPLAEPKEVKELTKAIQAPEEEVAATPLPVQSERPEPQTVAIPTTPITPDNPTPSEAKIDFNSVLEAQTAGLRQESEAMAEKPPAPTLITDEEVSFEAAPMPRLKDEKDVPTATDKQLEDVVGIGNK